MTRENPRHRTGVRPPGGPRAGAPLSHDPVLDPPVGSALGPATPMAVSAREAVLDAAALLQVRRSEAAALLAEGRYPEATIIAVGYGAIQTWMHTVGLSWREMLSVRPAGTVAQLRASLPVNRRMIAQGLRMVSVFDCHGLEPEARILVANETIGDYVLAWAPVQMKIVDRELVLLQGPEVDGRPSLMGVHGGPLMEAAWRYWDAVLASAIPPDPGASGTDGLTARQRQVIAMLTSDLGDQAIATALGVSVRTIRSDIAAILQALGVTSRFAAGVRFARLQAG